MRNQGYRYRDQVGPADAGGTVLAYLAARYRHTGAEEWAARIGRGEVTLDGAIAGADDRLRAGAWLVWERPPWDEPDVPLAFEVLHEDAATLAVAKPSGLPTVPAGGFLDHTLLARVRLRWPGATPLHRLGRGTSGVVLFARTAAARASLFAAFREGGVEKRYRALASGRIAGDRFAIEAPIGPVPHPVLGTVHGASPAGRPSRSRVTVLERRADATLVAVDLDTGRPHQIRIHLAVAGHPLVGDPLYGTGGVPRPGALPGDLGYLLHAWRLAFDHPVTGRRLELEAPPPSELS